MDMRFPPLDIKIMLEANPLKSRILVWRLAVVKGGFSEHNICADARTLSCRCACLCVCMRAGKRLFYLLTSACLWIRLDQVLILKGWKPKE